MGKGLAEDLNSCNDHLFNRRRPIAATKHRTPGGKVRKLSAMVGPDVNGLSAISSLQRVPHGYK
jgi:hypothetical protein